MKTTPTSRAEMYIRQATPDNYRSVLREIRQKEIYKLIIDTNPKHMSHFFRAVSVAISIRYINVKNNSPFYLIDFTASNEWLSIPLHVHDICKYI